MARTVYDKLRALQDVLSRKFEVEREIQEIPKSLATKTELLARLRKSLSERAAQADGVKARLTDVEQRLAEAEGAREQYEGQMDAIKTQREYEALDKEIRDATEKEQGLRKELLKEQQADEELRAALEKDQLMIQKQEEDVEEEKDRRDEFI